MNKYLNIIIIGFFAILISNFDFCFTLYIPIILILASYNSKSLIILIPLSLISIYLFRQELFIATIFLFVLVTLYILFLERKKNIIIDSIYTFLMCFGLLLFIKGNISINKIYIDVIYSLISFFLYIIIKWLIKLNQGNFIYFEVIAIITSILGSSYISAPVNIAYIISCLYAMYFTCNTGIIFSELFSFLCTTYLIYTYKMEFALILPLIAAVYSIGNILSSFCIVILTCIVGVFYPQYFEYILITDVVCIFFELFKNIIVIKKISKKEVFNDIYKTSIENLNKEILAFSSFLDMCTKDVLINKEYNQTINDGIKSFGYNYCNKCYLNKKCLKDIDSVEEEMKSLIINCKNSQFDLSKTNYLSICPYNIEMKKSSIIINNRINDKDFKLKNKVMNNTLNNISLMLRHYTIDNSIKKEMNIEYIYKVKRALCDNGYNICYYEIEKNFEYDFEIIIGVRGFSYLDIKTDIESILNNVMYCPVSVEYSHAEKSKIYLKMIPQRKIKVEYTSTNIAYGLVSGDNVIVKERSGKTISVICDGMGKGSKANEISTDIKKSIEELLKTSISTYGIVQILNTYCNLKNNLEAYSTLDLLEIDQCTKSISFYKLGASPSYVYHYGNLNKIEKIENTHLPLGNEGNIEMIDSNVTVGDIIIMSSDGIFENLTNEKELEDFINSITYMNVEKIAYQIMNYVKNSIKINEDDISLVVLKVLES